jgi:hypothetical protein
LLVTSVIFDRLRENSTTAEEGGSAMEVAKKLQLKDASKVRVVNLPGGVELDVETSAAEAADAVLVFAKNKAELEQHAEPAVEAARADRLSWIAYPKAGKLGTDLNRDILAHLLDDNGVRPVRQVAIDDTWSALRFRAGKWER